MRKEKLTMEIIKTQIGNTCAIELTGRIDTITSPKLQAALDESILSAVNIELDFTEVDYVSSAGLRVLLQGEKTANSAGKTMTLKNVTPEVMEVFDITGFSAILTIK